jgi:hypothetical protein
VNQSQFILSVKYSKTSTLSKGLGIAKEASTKSVQEDAWSHKTVAPRKFKSF